MKILLLSRYGQLGASSRYRSYQYLEYLRDRGHDITVNVLLSDEYIRKLYAGRRLPAFNIILSYVRRALRLASKKDYDLLWIEYELFPWIPQRIEGWFQGRQIPYVVDYDDAIFHRYDFHRLPFVQLLLGTKIADVMRQAAGVIVGNPYLGGYATRAGAKRIEKLPTTIDVARYPRKPPKDNGRFTVGWVGSPSTVHYLALVHEAIRKLTRTTNITLKVVGVDHYVLPGVQVEASKWNDDTEADEICQFDVGIMPLTDSPWERGKCGHKLIKYMACSRPVIASPIGVNKIIVNHGRNGFLASTTEEWVEALVALSNDSGLRERMGTAGRDLVEREYSTQVIAPRLEAFFRKCVEEHP
ncbi:MAG: glycosyltransferase family 4 protein [Ignavibacteriales bacterium]|nr:glycosyltransferase family 4 protein [Ignavibacteriales bacterium]